MTREEKKCGIEASIRLGISIRGGEHSPDCNRQSLRVCLETFNKTPMFEFDVGITSRPPAGGISQVIIGESEGYAEITVAIPQRWQKSMRAIAENPKGKIIENNCGIIFGHINYLVKRNHACTCSYYPFELLTEEERRGATGLPYLAEFVTTACLQSYGVNSVSTSSSPSPERIRQLRRVGLPVLEEIPIDKWLHGMLGGIDYHIARPK